MWCWRRYGLLNERVLVSMKHYIGDAVMAEPMLQALEHRFTQVEVLTGGVVDQVLWRPEVERRFVKAPRVHNPWQVVRQAAEIRKRHYDTVILVNHSFRSALTARLAGIRRRIGHSTEGRGPLLTEIVENDPELFEASNLMRLAAAAGADGQLRTPHLPTTEEERAAGRRLAAGAVVGIQPGARWPLKQIPVDVTCRVASALSAGGYTIALLGGAEEAEVAGVVRETLGNQAVWLVGETDVRQTLGVLCALRAMLGADTGLMHLAAGVGVPSIAVFGPTPHRKWGHDYSPHQVVAAPAGTLADIGSDTLIDAVREALNSS